MLVLLPSYLASSMSWFQHSVHIQVLTPSLQNTSQVIQLTFGKLFIAGPDCSSFQSISSKMNKNVLQLKPTLFQQNHAIMTLVSGEWFHFILFSGIVWLIGFWSIWSIHIQHTQHKYTWTGVWTVCYYTGLLVLDQIQKPSTQPSSDIYSCLN